MNHPKAGAHLIGDTLKLFRIGEIKVILHQPIPDGFELKQATILHKADGWYVSLSLEDGAVPDARPVDEIKSAVGIDVGQEKFLATSDGQAVEIPQYYRKAQRQLARQQRRLSRKQQGSKSYDKQANKVARLHLHVARQRQEFHYQVAHWRILGCKSYEAATLNREVGKPLLHRLRLGGEDVTPGQSTAIAPEDDRNFHSA